MNSKICRILIILLLIGAIVFAAGCVDTPSNPKSASDVQRITVKLPTDSNGRTIEQNNVAKRLEMDNKPGSIKHLYVISAYTGDVIIYSTVNGKVTSSGKRLNPYKLTGAGKFGSSYMPINIGGEEHRTAEVLEDDGTYGQSIPYIYWWDTKGVYHQHYVADDQIVHISDQPLVVPKIIINMELTAGNATSQR